MNDIDRLNNISSKLGRLSEACRSHRDGKDFTLEDAEWLITKVKLSQQKIAEQPPKPPHLSDDGLYTLSIYMRELAEWQAQVTGLVTENNILLAKVERLEAVVRLAASNPSNTVELTATARAALKGTTLERDPFAIAHSTICRIRAEAMEVAGLLHEQVAIVQDSDMRAIIEYRDLIRAAAKEQADG